MKKSISLFLCVCLTVSLLLPFTAAAQEKKRDFMMPTGTFIQASLYMSYSDEMLENEFKKMKEMGIDLIHFSNLASRDSENDDWVFEYPTTAAQYKNAEKTDIVTRMMDYCKKYDITFYFGLGLDGSWWNRDLSKSGDAQWMLDVADMSCFLVKDSYAMYEAKYGDVFGGYYWVYEIWNHNSWNNATTRSTYAKNLAEAFNKIIDCINETCPEKAFWFSPFATRTGFATKENMTAFYTEFFKKTKFRSQDAMAPMDNIGGGGQILSTLEEWTKAYYDAFKNSGTKLQFWSNCESFVQATWSACTMDRFEQQLRITSKYCSKIITFTYNHYFSSNNCLPGYDKAYKDLLTKGELEKVKPSLPSKAAYTATPTAINLRWGRFTDDYDIAAYTLERYNSNLKSFYTIFSTVAHGRGGMATVAELPREYTDSGFIKGEDKVYRLTATDCSGNVSDPIYILILWDESGKKALDITSLTGEKKYLTQAEYDAYLASKGEKPATSQTTSQPTANESSTISKSDSSKPADEISSETNNSSAAPENSSQAAGQEGDNQSQPSSTPIIEGDDGSENNKTNQQTVQGDNILLWICGVVGICLPAAVALLIYKKKAKAAQPDSQSSSGKETNK